MSEADYGTGLSEGPALKLMLVVLVVGGPLGALAVSYSMSSRHWSSAITAVTGIGIAVGAWVGAALLVLLLQIRDSLRTLASDAARDR